MKVAFIGMGTMGGPMARNILDAGHEVTVHNRTREREKPLKQAGAQRAASPQEAAAGAEMIIICFACLYAVCSVSVLSWRSSMTLMT